MAYRRKGGSGRASTLEDFRSDAAEATPAVAPPPPLSIAARAIRDSSAHGDSSLSSVYGQSAIASANRESNRQKAANTEQDSTSYEYTSMNSFNESKNGFWGVIARKAKAFLEDDPVAQKLETYEREHPKMVDKKSIRQLQINQSQQPAQIYSKMENPPQKSSDSISSSLNYIGGTIKNALEEGLTIMENKTADIIQETRKLQIRRKGANQTGQNQALNRTSPNNFPQIQADYETQLKASRDVANAMAAKAKLLMREMKTVKADLAFSKERCTQLEEENKILREGLEKGSNPEDDDLIRLQLETLLAEKGRLAHENSVYARENRFLREIVEYHQLTMQDVVYMDEGAEEVTEVCPIPPRSTLPAASAAAAPRFSPPELTSIVVPEACPIVPMPPAPSPRSSNGISPATAGTSPAPSCAAGD